MRIKNNNALSPVISAVLAAAVVTATVGAVMLWGVPYIERLDSQSARENVESQMNVISGVVDSLISSDVGDKKTNVLAFSGGSISAGDDIDQTVVTYSHDPDFDFTVTDIRDDGVEINFISGDVEDISADMFFTNCFLSGTKVLMADGSYKNIEDIMINDTVKSYDIESGVPQDRSVTGLHNVEVTGSYIEIDQLRVTPDHEFYSAGNWILADNINSGVVLFGFNGIDYTDYTVNGRFDHSEQYGAYDLEIDGNYPYFVSIQDEICVLVHSREAESNLPPYTPSNPVPSDGASNVVLDVVLRWSGGDPDGDDVWYDIYLDTVNPPRNKIISGLMANSYSYELEYLLQTYYWKIVARDNHNAISEGPIWSFTTMDNTLSVQTLAASDINHNMATLHGKIINDGGENCQIRFGYKLSADDGPWIYQTDWHGSYKTDDTFQEIINELISGEEYEYRVEANNGFAEKVGEELLFTTLPLPDVITYPAENVTLSSATLIGFLVDNGGYACEVGFKYSPNSYSSIYEFIAADSAGLVQWTYTPGWYSVSGNNISFNDAIVGLNGDTNYVFRAGAQNVIGTGWGDYKEIIREKMITVISPNGGEIWLTNSTQDIRWSWQGFDSNISIGLHVWDYYYSIAENIQNTGLYRWNIPSDLITGYQFEISITGPGVAGWSEGFFSIIQSGTGVFTLNATEITSNAAKLNGKLVDISGQVRFRYRVLGSPNWTYTSYLPGNYEAGESFNQKISGLLPGVTYEYQAGVKKLGFDELWGGSIYFKTRLHEGFQNQIPDEQINITYNANESSLQIEFLSPITETFVIDLYITSNGNCFLAGTKVLMADGSYKNIEDIMIGDMVKSYDEETGSISDKKVKNVFHQSPDEMAAEYYMIINDVLKVTPNHRFYSEGNWVAAEYLKIGDNLFSKTGEEYSVYSIDHVYDKVPTFDLEIEGYHNYFISINNDIDILVHNNDPEGYIGSIFCFRSNSMSYTRPSADKTEGYVFEKGGIISYDDVNDKWAVKDARFIYDTGSFFSMNIIETNFSAFSTNTGLNNMINLRLSSDLEKSLIIGNKEEAYNLRLQFFGEYQDSWMDYLNNNYNFDIDYDNPSLKYTGEDGVNLVLTYSMVNIIFQ